MAAVPQRDCTRHRTFCAAGCARAGRRTRPWGSSRSSASTLEAASPPAGCSAAPSLGLGGACRRAPPARAGWAGRCTCRDFCARTDAHSQNFSGIRVLQLRDSPVPGQAREFRCRRRRRRSGSRARSSRAKPDCDGSVVISVCTERLARSDDNPCLWNCTPILIASTSFTAGRGGEC